MLTWVLWVHPIAGVCLQLDYLAVPKDWPSRPQILSTACIARWCLPAHIAPLHLDCPASATRFEFPGLDGSGWGRMRRQRTCLWFGSTGRDRDPWVKVVRNQVSLLIHWWVGGKVNALPTKLSTRRSNPLFTLFRIPKLSLVNVSPVCSLEDPSQKRS